MTAFATLAGRAGIDEAWARLTPAQAKAAGMAFVVGYVSEDTTGKNITQGEVAGLRADDVAVLLVYEYSVTAAEGGSAKGTRDAGIAVGQARALGYPHGCAVAFAIDEGSPNTAGLLAYSRAFTAACHAAGYRSMVYGGYNTVRTCLDNKAVDLGWQTYAWSNGLWDARAAIRQVQNDITINGQDVDRDVAMVNDIGAWGEITVSTADNWAQAYSQGVDHYQTDNGTTLSNEPVKWRLRDEAWQAAVNAQLTALAAALAKVTAALPGSEPVTKDEILAQIDTTMREMLEAGAKPASS